MKNMDLLEALNYIDEKFIRESEEADTSDDGEAHIKSPLRKRIKWLSPIAALLAIAILFTGIIMSATNPMLAGATEISSAVYPQMTKFPKGDITSEEYRAQYSSWRNDINKQKSYFGDSSALNPFVLKSINEFLSESGDENVAYSPLNVYLTLAMLAEMADGDTQNQILNLLDCDSVFELRSHSHNIWNANYRDDGVVKSVVASSVWLSDEVNYNVETANTLSTQYYATVYEGKIGSQKYNEMYYEWIDEHTGGLFADRLDDTPLRDGSVISIATALNYEASWNYGFSGSRTSKGVFHSYYGDVSCTYMNKIEIYGGYYWGKSFTATSKPLKDSGNMYFILPNEGVSVDDLLVDDEALRFIVSDGEWENQDDVVINLTVPKMNITSSRDLKFGLYELGVKDCFFRSEDGFANLTKDPDDAAGYYVNAINHNVIVSVDEDGVKGAAYSEIGSGEGTPAVKSDVDFKVNKPFIFVITGADSTILFIGVVNQPVE